MKRYTAVMVRTPTTHVMWLKQLIEAPEQRESNKAARDVPQGRQVAEESVNL